jgi:hypothetical protein
MNCPFRKEYEKSYITNPGVDKGKEFITQENFTRCYNKSCMAFCAGIRLFGLQITCDRCRLIG